MNETWTTKDGRVLLIGNMESSHIVNAVNMRLRQIHNINRTIQDMCQDFEDDFGQDFEVAAAINLCGDEYKQKDKYMEDIKNLVYHLALRGLQINVFDNHRQTSNRVPEGEI